MRPTSCRRRPVVTLSSSQNPDWTCHGLRLHEHTTLINTETINISVDSFFLDKNENEIKGDFPLVVQRYQDYGYQGRD